MSRTRQPMTNGLALFCSVASLCEKNLLTLGHQCIELRCALKVRTASASHYHSPGDTTSSASAELLEEC